MQEFQELRFGLSELRASASAAGLGVFSCRGLGAFRPSAYRGDDAVRYEETTVDLLISVCDDREGSELGRVLGFEHRASRL